ncbi:hypothetical protein HDF16_001919 [Granulicella aggregans]|uniref:Uncharacterized protein n=1 Tax=Granulicella aggregans TaxID=474949 RepID=A0A7W7ZC71_9BACT|nr:hypothetical protein [Granulicella aggregans]MBB5057234.1 hypothetical protein [Granulicella aggregans]
MSSQLVPATAPVSNRLRAYFAPVNRATGTPTFFDPARQGTFALDTPPTPWIDLGWTSNFTRKSASKIAQLRTGAPAIVQTQVRSEVEATLSLDFESWGKLQLAVSSASEQLNLLVTAIGTNPNGSGGTAITAVPITLSGSSATALNVGSAASTFNIGDIVAVDLDYTGQTGYVGSGVAAAYVTSSAAVAGDVSFIRRVTLNVGRVTAIASGILTLGSPLLAGAPTAGMQISRVAGFCDREGGSFFQEWSALFVFDGQQGDRILYHYPRLQPLQGASEIATALPTTSTGLATQLERTRLAAAFRALPVTDANDSASVLCFRSYLPGPLRTL